ncbi:MAG: putative bifunctional diguanylate cyclase/phosphodiesterase [Hyphomicrobiales bacterium]
MTIQVRPVIKIAGATIAVVVGIVIPLGYIVHELHHARQHVFWKAERSAEQVAVYAYKIGPLWPYTQLRLEEILARRSAEDKSSRQRIVGPTQKVIFEEERALDWPILVGRVPIRVADKAIGWIEAEESQAPLLKKIGLLAAICGMLGIAAFFSFRVLPLRVLDRAFATLETRNTELRNQYVISDAALNNMSQGLCMFDAEQRLVICNKRYTDLYSLPGDLTKPGTPLTDIIAHRIATGDYGGAPEQYRRDRLATVAAKEQRIEIVEQRDGRVIQILHDPLPNGGWVATHEDITERRRAEARIAHLASHDLLTELPNRVLLREKLEAALAKTAQGGGFAVHCLDLDRFKEVNDTLGHSMGDELLKQVAERLRNTVREANVVARLGGDEFAVIQFELDRPEAASALANRITEVIGEPYHIDGQRIIIGTSVGVALAPSDGLDPDQLLKNADLALYRAKEDGRGTVRFFEREMDARLQARRLFEAELRAALGNGELEVYYQPVFNLAANEISGFEALLRWNHPTRGMVSPAEFIPVAEDTGLIIPIGEWVLRQACAEAATWPAPLLVAVNLSAVQFKSSNLVGTVMSALASAGLVPARLELEVTESVLLLESQATRATLHRLRELGVRIAMDDFGTGYSSLSYLRSFPFDKIKIDRSFIRDLSTKPGCTAIVHAIAELARSLGMATTAEGVETEEHLRLLRAEGCTEIQGYLISPPKPAEYVPSLLAKYNGTRAAEPAPVSKLARVSF